MGELRRRGREGVVGVERDDDARAAGAFFWFFGFLVFLIFWFFWFFVFFGFGRSVFCRSIWFLIGPVSRFRFDFIDFIARVRN